MAASSATSPSHRQGNATCANMSRRGRAGGDLSDRHRVGADIEADQAGHVLLQSLRLEVPRSRANAKCLPTR
jgi:hypothetical protein